MKAVAHQPDGHHLATTGNDGTRIWDASTGRPADTRMSLLPNGEVAVFDAATGVLTGAWRWLGWVGVVDGVLTRLHAETFGELPPLAEPVRR